jgi:hypothetical protein
VTLWWLQPGWTETRCANCGAKIWPQGDPDWGLCEPCFTAQLQQQYPEEQFPDETALLAEKDPA